ncbi:hypothetical protein TNCV_4458661 [Trichonephila clavipes]|nr:hypothetical protein TNCV_4458661 [Trichonephila clavipes]
MQSPFCLEVASITIRPSVLVTPYAVDFEARDSRRNCACELDKGLTCLRTLASLGSRARGQHVMSSSPNATGAC